MWKLNSKEAVLEVRPFTVERLVFEPQPNIESHPYYRLKAPDWVNIVPITKSGDILLVRQFRPGPLLPTLETPGGVVDSHEKDPTLAALRELEEETGYSTRRMLLLGSINPNPAIQTNRLHMFLALECEEPSLRRHHPDQSESIELVKVPKTEINSLMRSGRIDSALCCLAISFAQQYLNK